MRAALELGCCPQSLVRAGSLWKMVCTVCAANTGQREYLVEIRYSCSPGMSKTLALHSWFHKLLWFQWILPHFPERSPLVLVFKLNSLKRFLPPVHILFILIRFRLNLMVFIQLPNLEQQSQAFSSFFLLSLEEAEINNNSVFNLRGITEATSGHFHQEYDRFL